MAELIVILGSIGAIIYFIYDFIHFYKLLKEDEARWAERIAHINSYIKEKRKELEKAGNRPHRTARHRDFTKLFGRSGHVRRKKNGLRRVIILSQN